MHDQALTFPLLYAYVRSGPDKQFEGFGVAVRDRGCQLLHAEMANMQRVRTLDKLSAYLKANEPNDTGVGAIGLHIKT